MSDPLSPRRLQTVAAADSAMTRGELVTWLCAALRTPVAEIDDMHELAQEVTRSYQRDGVLTQMKVKSVNKLAAAKLLITLLGWNKPEPDPTEAESEAAWTAFLKKAASEPQPWELEMQRRAERDATAVASMPETASEAYPSHQSYRSSESYPSTPGDAPVLPQPPAVTESPLPAPAGPARNPALKMPRFPARKTPPIYEEEPDPPHAMKPSPEWDEPPRPKAVGGPERRHTW